METDNKELTLSEGQIHQITLGMVGMIIFAIIGIPEIPTGQFPKTFLNLSVEFWFWIALLIPILHQITIAPLWRVELLDQRLTKFFGSTERAFLFFKILFALFFIPRLFIAIPLAYLTRESMSEMMVTFALFLAILMTPIIIYGFYSVKKYFGINRAFGADHFFESYRKLPKVNEGIFKYTNNAMYTFVLSITWIPSLFLLSRPGTMVGIFNHLFVWVHYYFIEKPDMEFIFGGE